MLQFFFHFFYSTIKFSSIKFYRFIVNWTINYEVIPNIDFFRCWYRYKYIRTWFQRRYNIYGELTSSMVVEADSKGFPIIVLFLFVTFFLTHNCSLQTSNTSLFTFLSSTWYRIKLEILRMCYFKWLSKHFNSFFQLSTWKF